MIRKDVQPHLRLPSCGMIHQRMKSIVGKTSRLTTRLSADLFSGSTPFVGWTYYQTDFPPLPAITQSRMSLTVLWPNRPIFLLAIAGMFSICALKTTQAQTFTNEYSRLQSLPASDITIQNIALADYNADGLLDMYHTGRLYRQALDGSFHNVLEQADIRLEGNAVRGGIFGDANKDGLLDLLIMDGAPGSRFYLNRSGEKFDLGNSSTNLIFQDSPIGGFWADVNQDGFLDFVVGTSNGNNPVFLGSAGDGFINVGALMGSDTGSPTCGLAVADYDQDLDPDFFAARCGAGNELKINNSNSDRYTTTRQGAGVESTAPSLEGRWFDYNNDGWEDLLVVNTSQDLKTSYTELYRNDGGQLINVAEEAGIRSFPNLPNGPAAIADFDNDGWQDIYLPFNNQGRLYHNQGDGTFEDIWEMSIALDSTSDTVVGMGDLNNDGWMDLVIPDQFGTAIMINDGGDNNWATFQLRDATFNRFAVGARIHLFSGDTEQIRVIRSGSGDGTQHDELRAHFGVGSSEVIDRVLINWPDGIVEEFTNLAVNHHYTFVQFRGQNDPPNAFRLMGPVNAGFVETSTETILFEWEAANDVDGVDYTLNLSGPGLRLSFPAISEPFLEMNTEILPKNQIYSWSVTATDGFSIRGSSDVNSFSFGQPDVANSTLQEPALYDFGLPRISSGIAEFADYDLDGDLDLLVGGDTDGTSVLTLYRANDAEIILDNNGGEYIFKSLVDSGVSLEQVSQPNASWGDFDRDGDPDLVISGVAKQNGQPLTQIYINQVGLFIPLEVQGLPNVWGGVVKWVDLNGDGYEDLFISGATSLTQPYDLVADVWINNTGQSMTPAEAGISPFMFGDAAFADIDSDGDQDLAITGDFGNGRFGAAILNNQNVGSGGVFTPTGTGLPDVMGGSVNWGDVNGDGKPDLMLTGGELGPDMLRGISIMLVNQGGTFLAHPFPFDGVVTGTAIWGDYENDGDEDVFIVGARSPLGETVGRLYRNVEGQFVAELDVKGFVHAAAAFGDYNGDGDLDLIAFGIDADGNLSTTFYINQQVPEPVPVTR